MMLSFMRATALVLVMLLTDSCLAQTEEQFQANQSKTSNENPAERQQAEEAIPPPAPGALFPAVVARINERPILGRDLEQRIRIELASLGSPAWQNLREEYRQELIGRHMTSLVGTELLYQNAKGAGVKVTETEIQAEFDNLARTFPNDAALNTELAARGMDREALWKEIEKSLVVAIFINQNVTRHITVTPAEVADYYKTHTEEFRHGDMVRTSHILIRTPENATPDQVQRARERAGAVLAKVKNGEDFGKLAKDYSMDSSASEGGDIGFVQRGQLEPEYEKVAFSMKVGDTSDLVRTLYGFHIIKVTEFKKAGLATLSEINDDLTDFLKSRKSDDELDRLVRDLRDKAKIVVYIPLPQAQESSTIRP